MKLARFQHDGVTRIGVVEGDEVVNLTAADASIPREMNALLAEGPAGLERVASAVNSGGGRLPLADVHLESPLRRPPKILAVGVNYATHAEEAKQAGIERPKVPMIFNKQSTSITGPTDPVHLPRVSKLLDYEGELGIVIGRRCRHVAKENAAEVVAGYTVVNDVTVRDWQFKSPTFTMGKSFDSHCPTGPWIVTSDELGDPHGLQLRTFVNDELRQDAKTDGLLFDCWEIIEHLSTAFTLEPGDLIATGTPAGVGVAMKPPVWLARGDVVRVEIEGIGTIENRVIDEPADTAYIG
jgi:2-keto-4-pentenoate hydratase/2-oxohepta-3-ene-1,7-dioic acid hydratase in catechol pathway